MVITGPPGSVSPTSSVPTAGCQVTNATTSPGSNGLDGSNHLTSPETVTAITNGDPACSGIQARFDTSITPANFTAVMNGPGPSYTYTLSTSTATFAADNVATPHQTVDILSSDGSLVLFFGATFDINGCTVSSVSFSPHGQTAGDPAPVDAGFHLTGAITVTVNTNADPSCTGIAAQYSTASPSFSHVLTASGGGTFTDTLTAGATGGTWSAANPQAVNILASDGTTTLISAPFFVQSPGCVVTSVTFAPNPNATQGAAPHPLANAEKTTITTNNDPSCSSIKVRYLNASPVLVDAVVAGVGPGVFTDTVPANGSNTWTGNVQNVTIVKSDGTTLVSGGSGWAFSLNPIPTVTGCNPSSEPKNTSGVTVVISGTNFVPGATVTIPNFTITNVTVNSPTQLTVTANVANGSVKGTYDAVVANPDGSSGTGHNCMTIT